MFYCNLLTKSIFNLCRVFDSLKLLLRLEDRRNSRKMIKMKHSIIQAVPTERCKHVTNLEGWLIRLPMPINSVNRPKQLRLTLLWRKRSSVNLTFLNLFSLFQNNLLTCGLPWTLKMSSLRKYSLWQERFTQLSKILPLQFPTSTVYLPEDRLMAYPDSIKWSWRPKRLIGPNHLNMPDLPNKEKNIQKISASSFWARRRWIGCTRQFLTLRNTNSTSSADNHITLLHMLNLSSHSRLRIKQPWTEGNLKTEPKSLTMSAALVVSEV